MLTEADIKRQRELNAQTTENNEYALPLDAPYELMEIIDKCQKELITDSLRECADCLRDSLGASYYGIEPPIKVIDYRSGEKCEGFKCENIALFMAFYTNKL